MAHPLTPNLKCTKPHGMIAGLDTNNCHDLRQYKELKKH
jgi:hypothetical protein